MSKKPLIVFEGIEGSGKSHHIKVVSRFLDKNKIKYDYYEFNQGHGVNMDNLNSFLKWIKEKY